MRIEILNCLKHKRDICIKNIMLCQKTVFIWIPALIERNMRLELGDMSLLRRQPYVNSLGCLRQKAALFEIFSCMYVHHRVCLDFEKSKFRLFRFGRISTVIVVWMWTKTPVSCGKSRFRRRRAWKQVKIVQIPTTKADLFFRIFEAIPGIWNALKSFRI